MWRKLCHRYHCTVNCCGANSSTVPHGITPISIKWLAIQFASKYHGTGIRRRSRSGQLYVEHHSLCHMFIKCGTRWWILPCIPKLDGFHLSIAGPDGLPMDRCSHEAIAQWRLDTSVDTTFGSVFLDARRSVDILGGGHESVRRAAVRYRLGC